MDIFKLLYVERLTPSAIAEALNRKPSSITREIAKGMDNGMYNPVIAEAGHLEARRNQRPRLKTTDEAWAIIKPQLEKRWSPEEVAKWLKKEYPDYAVSGKTIYNYIFFHMKGELKKLALQDLRLRGKARKKGKEGEKRGKIPGMTLIDTRPAEINARSAAGHWEGDLIIGKDHKSAILVTVERKSRFVQMDLLQSWDAQTVRKTIEKRFKRAGRTVEEVHNLRPGEGEQRTQRTVRTSCNDCLFLPSAFAVGEGDVREHQLSDSGHAVSCE
jgi:IS30 family transposase